MYKFNICDVYNCRYMLFSNQIDYHLNSEIWLCLCS